MLEIGRMVVKVAGRDAGMTGDIVDILDNNFVLVDGQVRRRKCNMLHIEPLNKLLDIQKGASHEVVIKALKAEGIEVVERKPRQKAAPQAKPVAKEPKKAAKKSK